VDSGTETNFRISRRDIDEMSGTTLFTVSQRLCRHPVVVELVVSGQ
jgi:hypothetical protein